MGVDIDRLRQYRERMDAKRSLARARIRAHEAFDQLWKQGYMSRGCAYAWLAEQFGCEAHMAEMTEEECERVIGLVQEWWAECADHDNGMAQDWFEIVHE